jgi:hypothetical protein
MSTGDPHSTYVIYLLGYPGVGKYTIATEIAAMTGAVVVDNQLINHPVLTLLDWDGVSMLPPEIWRPIGQIREAVLAVLEDVAPRSISYVLTNALEDGPEGDALFGCPRLGVSAGGAELRSGGAGPQGHLGGSDPTPQDLRRGAASHLHGHNRDVHPGRSSPAVAGHHASQLNSGG